MPLDFGPLTSPSVPIAAAAGATGAGLPQPNIAALSLPGFGGTPEGVGAAAPSGAPPSAPPQNDPLSGVMNKIASGESGGSDPYHETYGGGHFGWEGVSNTGSGKYGFVKSTWDSASKFWMSQNPGKPPPDFNNPDDQDKVGRLWAIKTYGVDRSGKTLSQAAQVGKVDYSRLAGQWPSLGHPGGATGYAQDKADIRAQESEINKKIGDLAEKIGSLDARDPASLKELAHYREEMEKYQQQALQLATHPPQFNPGQSMQQQGGMALIIGMLGGLLTKRPLIASLNAGAAAMNAYNKGDQQEYQRNLDQWKVSTDAMFKMAEFEHQMYADTLKDEKLSEGEKLDKIQAQASLLGNQRMLLASQSQNLDQVQNHDLQYQQMLAIYKAKPTLIKNPDGTVSEWTPGMGLQDTGIQPGSDKFGASGPRSMPGMVMQQQMQAFEQAHPNASPQERADYAMNIATEYRRNQSIETSFGSGINGRNLVSLNTLADHIKLFREYADALKTGNLQDINRIEQAIATKTGSPEVINFVLAGTISGDETIRLLTTTGGTLADREDIHKLLAAYASPAQMQGAADTLEKYVAGRYEPLRQQYARGDPQREAYFDNNMVTPEARQLFSKPAGMPAAGGAAPAAARAPSPAASVPLPEGVPAGSHQVGTHDGNPVFLGPDGKRYEVQP